jgi:hypothetical protein
MSFQTWLLRSLWFHRRMHLAVAGGAVPAQVSERRFLGLFHLSGVQGNEAGMRVLTPLTILATDQHVLAGRNGFLNHYGNTAIGSVASRMSRRLTLDKGVLKS